MKLLVASTTAEAQFVAKAFDLGPEWKAIGWGDALGAPRVEKIVVMPLQHDRGLDMDRWKVLDMRDAPYVRL